MMQNNLYMYTVFIFYNGLCIIIIIIITIAITTTITTTTIIIIIIIIIIKYNFKLAFSSFRKILYGKLI